MINNSGLGINKNGFTAINFIYYAIMFGLISFALISYLIIADTVEATDESLLNIFTFIVPSFAIVMIFISRLIFTRLAQQVDSLISL